MGKPIVMGRRTFVSIGRPLPGRHNIVLTRGSWTADGVTVAGDLDAALAAAGGVDEEVMIIGGAAVYADALPRADRVYLTEVHAEPAGDTLLPPFGPEWRETARVDHVAAGDAPGYSLVTLERH